MLQDIPNDVDQCFVEDIVAIKPTGDKIQAFLNYVFETYIDPSGLFPSDVWTEFKAKTNRTTNVCESFHSRLNGIFNWSHPNIYNFIDQRIKKKY
ncbi:MULE domain-containing protein [Aphis craccivora]|uniref:MULE domain-containing protein n=1 Tax=Aphis craccivora TaxID=307492 RepID=A0A6G0ZL90_APHCR|nr:MULE domain-containing protein [Aphis craccivora]